MSVTRIGEVAQRSLVQPGLVQPSLVRTVPVLTDSTSTFSARLQSLLRRTTTASAEAADVLVALVVPTSLIALVLGLWRLTVDVGWTQDFPISSGFFSHWQVWVALAIGLKFGGSALLAKVTTEQDSQVSGETDRPA